MKILKNPWNNLFFELTSASSKSIKIAAPFVKESIVSQMLKHKNADVDISLITSFKLMNYFVGASDLEALTRIIEVGGSVKNFQKLHSKIYIFDDEVAVVSSANLTQGGLISNYEYGVLLDDDNVETVIDDYNLLSTDEITGNISLANILKAKEVIKNVPNSKKIELPDFEFITNSQKIDVYTGGVESIIKSLTGWKLAVFRCVNQINKTHFTFIDLELFIPSLKQQFPGNNNVEAKVRQQLQILRDIGLIQFNGNGNYTKLWI